MTDEILDVAIVGGGVSGVYSGWRLLGADPGGKTSDLKVAIFEMSDRIGGRLLSATPPGMPRTEVELGGMRYINSQTYARSIVENVFKLPTRDFETALPGNISYLRGTNMRVSQLSDPDLLPYNLAPDEVGKGAGELLLMALTRIVPGVDKMSDSEMEKVYKTYKYEGVHLYDWGFWNLLLKVVSTEAYNFLRDSSGYYSITTNWNAGDGIRMCLGDFKKGIKYNAVNVGLETVPATMAEEFEGAGGTIHKESRLRSFDASTLPDGTQGMAMVIEADGESRTVHARNLALAMPRRSLELMDQTGPLLDPANTEARRLINSVEGIPLFKLFIAYHEPWWEAADVSEGCSITTLPLRQCYYWGVEGRQVGANPDNQNAVLLASYEDVFETAFWRGLEDIAKDDVDYFEPKANAHDASVSDAALQHWNDHKAPRRMVEEGHRQLKILHGIDNAPDPYAAAYSDWAKDPYGGGVHFWNVGYDSYDCIDQMIKPLTDQPLYVIGEAYSKTQGWIEGAFETSELMLRDFGIAEPTWLTKPASGGAS